MTCLMKYLPALSDPAARILVARETQPQLKVSGGMIDESHKIYPHFGGVYKAQAMKWIFPSGSTIQFAGIPDDKALSGWQGSQLTNILIDEAAAWSETMVLFMLSRMRSASYGGKLQMVLTCNPDKQSFLYKWVKPLLDDDGVPKEGTENIVRWMVNINGSVYWGDSREELYEKYGYGKTLGKDFNPLSMRFIPMTCKDNPILLKNNPQYLSNLLAQNRVNQLRYLHGSWEAEEVGSSYWRREWCEVIDRIPPDVKIVGRVRGYDLASSPEPDSMSTNKNPDYTACALVSRDSLGTYYIEHVKRYRKRSGEVVQDIVDTAFEDGLDVPVVIPRDSGAGGLAYYQYLVRVLSEYGITTRMDKMSGHAGKLQRFLPFASMCEAGNVKVIRGDWNEEFFQELETFEPNKRTSKKDDQADTVATAFNSIAKQMHMPSFALPDLSRVSNLPF